MDALSHAAWGATVVRSPKLFGWAALAGFLPDLVPALYGVVRYGKRYFTDIIDQSFAEHPGNFYIILYRFTHSLIPITIVSLVLGVVAPMWLPLVIPYYLHLAMDVFTHRGLWATRLLYPLSDWHIDGWNWWQRRWVNIGNWSAIVILNLWFFLR